MLDERISGIEIMRIDIQRWMRQAMVSLVVATVATTGCSSGGWKMPSPSKMFPWGKKPNESTLTKSGASALTYPESPATKQTPNALASAAVKGPTTTMGTPSSTLPNSLATKPAVPPAFASAGAAGTTSYAPAGVGAAATANGYATGPYNTFGQTTPAASLATNGVPSKSTTPNPNAFAAAGQAPGGGSAPFAAAAPSNPAGMAPNNPYALAPTSLQGLPNSQNYAGATTRPATGPASIPNMATSGLAYANAPANSPKPSTNAVAAAPAAAGYSMPQATPNSFAAPPLPPGPQAGVPAIPVSGGMYTPVGATPTNGAVAQTSPSMPTMQGGFGVPATTASVATPNGFSQVPAQTASYSNANNASNSAQEVPAEQQAIHFLDNPRPQTWLPGPRTLAIAFPLVAP